MKLIVMIPTYRRAEDLDKCLGALALQQRPADQVIVVAQRVDSESLLVINRHLNDLPILPVIVDKPGLVTAMNAGLKQADGDILAITDDDSTPFSDWLQLIENKFISDETLAGVGGRDLIHKNGIIIEGLVDKVGTILWYGKIIANHHLQVSKPQYVDLLKGVNGAYRLPILKNIGFDRRLLGKGAQWHWELSLGLSLRQQGWKLLYDPDIKVHHYPGVLFCDRSRDAYNSEEVRNRCHNETLILMNHFGIFNKAIFLIWAVLVGTSESYGLVQSIRYIRKDRKKAFAKLNDTMHGRYQGVRSWLRR